MMVANTVCQTKKFIIGSNPKILGHVRYSRKFANRNLNKYWEQIFPQAWGPTPQNEIATNKAIRLQNGHRIFPQDWGSTPKNEIATNKAICLQSGDSYDIFSYHDS